MRALVIGGTGLTGRHIVRELAALGHRVAVFHRGQHAVELPPGVSELHGDKAALLSHRRAFEALTPDVVINMACMTRSDASTFVQTFQGIRTRAVVISSGDVYLAYGRIRETEPGPIQAVPLTEDSPLRNRLGPEGEAYDKTGVEAIVRSVHNLPCTIVRYPAVFGPHDGQRRFSDYFQRIRDGRPRIIIGEGEAGFRFTHAYSENAAHAVVLAATSEAAIGRTYNISESHTPTGLERLQQIAAVLSWRGSIVVVPNGELPDHLRRPNIELRQHLVLDDARIREELGYAEIVGPEEAIRRAFEWAANQPAELTQEYAIEDAVLGHDGHRSHS